MSAGKIASLIALNYHRQYSAVAVSVWANREGIKLETVQKAIAASRDIRSFPRIRERVNGKYSPIEYYQGIEPVHHETYPQWLYRWCTWIIVPVFFIRLLIDYIFG